MPVHRVLLAAALLGALSRPASAQDQGEFQACIDRAEGVSAAMLDCGKVQIDLWDGRLNAAYRALLDRADGKSRAALERDQRNWLKHHLEKTRRLADAPDNGSMAFLDSQAFELSDIAARTELLERQLKAGG